MPGVAVAVAVAVAVVVVVTNTRPQGSQKQANFHLVVIGLHPASKYPKPHNVFKSGYRFKGQSLGSIEEKFILFQVGSYLLRTSSNS